jgi:pyridoxine 5'-phosphate synthase PdxJ
MSDSKYFIEAQRLARAMVNSYPNNRLGVYLRNDQREKFENQLVEINKVMQKTLNLALESLTNDESLDEKLEDE